MKLTYAMIGVMIFFMMLGYCMAITPNAMRAETIRQQAIAAGKWKHEAGYSDYQRFTEANK